VDIEEHHLNHEKLTPFMKYPLSSKMISEFCIDKKLITNFNYKLVNKFVT
jgi:hypothetical protein